MNQRGTIVFKNLLMTVNLFLLGGFFIYISLSSIVSLLRELFSTPSAFFSVLILVAMLILLGWIGFFSIRVGFAESKGIIVDFENGTISFLGGIKTANTFSEIFQRFSRMTKRYTINLSDINYLTMKGHRLVLSNSYDRYDIYLRNDTKREHLYNIIADYNNMSRI